MRLGVVMDPIGSINYKKDSTLAMLWEAKKRGWEIYYFEQDNLFLCNSTPYGDAHVLKVFQDPTKWFAFEKQKTILLAELDVMLMRKDPPFNEKYIYTTYILDHAERLGTLVVNRPQALRDANEKFFITEFAQCAPPTLVTSSIEKLREFWKEHGDIIVKPLNRMGGLLVFRLQKTEINANVIFEELTQSGTFPIMAQLFIPEIKQGDKRILLIDGEVVPYVLARLPQGEDWRGNLAVGARGVAQSLTERERWICAQIGPTFRKKGLYFVGIDIIGDYLTEINVTSPTGIRELDSALGINISSILLDQVEKHIYSKK
jgi:glutathione synthase